MCSQTSVNDSECISTSHFQWARESPCHTASHLSALVSSLWLASSLGRIKTLALGYRTASGSAPSYFCSLLRVYMPSSSLRSVREWSLVVPSRAAQNHSQGHFLSMFLTGGMTYITPDSQIPHSLQEIIENSSLSWAPYCILLKIFLLLFWMMTETLYNWHFSCLLPSYDELLFVCFKLLWLKASAKWINLKCKYTRWQSANCKCIEQGCTTLVLEGHCPTLIKHSWTS